MMRPELKQISEALQSLFDDNVIRTKNLVGELGEYYCQELLGVKLCEILKKGFDVYDQVGKKVEIKTRRLPENSSKITFKSLDFDYCLFVELNAFFEPILIFKIQKDDLKRHLEKGRKRLTVGTIKKKIEHVRLYISS